MAHLRWEIEDFEKGYYPLSDSYGPILAWGLDIDGTCPQGADHTWHYIENPYTSGAHPSIEWEGFKIKSGLFYTTAIQCRHINFIVSKNRKDK